MLIALACLALVLLLICLFLRTDVLRAVRAKEDWRAQAIEADKSCRLLGERGAKLMSVIRDNNVNYQQLSDQLEDAEQELQEAELELAFERASLAAAESTIGFWIQQFNQVIEDCREERKCLLNSRSAVLKERNELKDTLAHARRGAAATLDDVIKERDDLLVAKEQLSKELLGCSDELRACNGRFDEATALLVKSQEEAAELAKEREDLIEQRNLGNNELCTVLEAIREKAHLFAIGVGVRQYAAEKGVALTVSSGMYTVASALDDMKSDLESRAERLRVVIRERDQLAAQLVAPTSGPAEDIAPPVPPAKRRLSIVGRKQAKRSR